MSLSSAYGRLHERLQDLATDLGEDETDARVPASPEWSVKDTYAHLAGAAADVVAGNTDGIGSDAWTANHVSSRRASSFEQVCREWAEETPHLLEQIEASGDALSRLVAGTWTHEQDIRGAVGLRGLAASAGVEIVLGLVDEAGGRIDEAGLGALRIEAEHRHWTLGSRPVATSLRTDSYELARLIYSRRSADQMRAMDWKGDSSGYIDVLPVYGPPDRDLDD